MLTRSQRENRTAWLLLTPILVYFIAFQAFPAFFSLITSFTDWIGVNSRPRFNGLQNYIKFFTDTMYLRALWNAFYIGVLVMTANIVLGLLGALLLDRPMAGKTVIRSIWYAPAVTSTVAVSQIFLMFIDPSAGIANRILVGVGIEPIAWGYSTFWMVFWIVLYSGWRGIGGSMIIWLAGLQSIDPTLYEAADVAGANSWQKFWNITIPGLRGIIVYILITGFIGALQIFEPVLFISQGGPFGSTEVIIYRIFRDFYGDFNFGMAGAGSIVITIIIVIFSLITSQWYSIKEGANA